MKMIEQNERPLVKKYNLSKVCEEVGISRSQLYKYIEKGIITPHKTPGGAPFFLEEEVQDLKKKWTYGV